MKKNPHISKNVIRRLPRYLRKLDSLQANGVASISSAELGQQLGLTHSQIRQDFSCFGEFGQQGYGYSVNTLREEISNILGMTRGFNVIVIGAGNLGHALIQNFGFERYGFRLTAAFDVDPAVIGSEIAGIRVFPSDELPDYLSRNRVDIAVLVTPQDLANTVAAVLRDGGVRAIWNFTNAEIDIAAPDMLIENIHFSDSLLTLSYYLAYKQDVKPAPKTEG